MARGGLRRIDAHLGGVRWAGQFTVDRPGAGSTRSRPGPTCSGPGATSSRARSAPASTTSAASCPRAACCSRPPPRRQDPAGRRADRARGRRARGRQRARDRQARRGAGRGARPRGRARPGAPRQRHPRQPLTIEVDRLRARFGSWYELFPRSWGGLRGVEAQLPRLAELGFDVVYLPPIHPIGLTNRKGRNNALTAAPGDPGSPWAIGDATGGHDAIHADLGTEDDLRSLTAAAAELGIDIALDFAINCSADHPWLTEHPEWFHRRPDGTLKYAENPPKRYQDIYNFNWGSPDWRSLWDALLAAILHWVDCGVKVFRVDNPHTKPFAFWEWLIGEVHRVDRDVIFLAEAFTKRSVMRHLGKIGFSQSYTYFTWKNSRWELTEYVSELAYSGEQEYFRPNFFANTPDILHEYLQHGGPPAFEARLVLAATLSPSYGIYSGYEHFENVPVRAGSEEYLHSEKYEIKQRALDGPLLPHDRPRSTAIRREHPALQELSNITFLDTAQRRADRLRQADARRDDRDLRRQPRPPSGPAGGGGDPREPRAAAQLHRPRRALGRALPVADRPQLRGAGPGRAPGPRAPRRAMSVGPPTLTHLLARERRPATARAATGPAAATGTAATAAPNPATSGSRPSRCGSSAPSSTRSTSAASSTPTATAPATSAA